MDFLTALINATFGVVPSEQTRRNSHHVDTLYTNENDERDGFVNNPWRLDLYRHKTGKLILAEYGRKVHSFTTPENLRELHSQFPFTCRITGFERTNEQIEQLCQGVYPGIGHG